MTARVSLWARDVRDTARRAGGVTRRRRVGRVEG
jgi:hypothetical protein